MPVAGGEFFYRYAGPDHDAPTIVHVHGFAISGTYLLPTAARLAADYHTYVPDLPGYGRTPGPRRPLGIYELADSLAAFCDSVNLQRPIFVGNSMGCAVIGRFIERYPERVERAVLVSPAGGLHSQPLLRGLSQLARDGLREPPSLITAAGPDYLKFGVINGLRLFMQLTQSPTVQLLINTTTPVLLVAGARDPLMPSMEQIRALADAAESRGHLAIARLTDAAHAINFSHPDQLAAVIRAYLADPTIGDSADLPDDVEILARARW